jgi:hypothetical protein
MLAAGRASRAGVRELRKSLFSSVAKHGKLLAGFNN